MVGPPPPRDPWRGWERWNWVVGPTLPKNPPRRFFVEVIASIALTLDALVSDKTTRMIKIAMTILFMDEYKNKI